MTKDISGGLWSFCRKLLSQGGDIWLDYREKTNELYNIRLDSAARERADELEKLFEPVPISGNPNTGHGHVYPRPDGVKMRCGGPAICIVCSLEQARKDRAPVVLKRVMDNSASIGDDDGTPPRAA